MIIGFIKKHCPRCGGNVYLDRDYDGWYERCLQCSYTHYLDIIVQAVGNFIGSNPLLAKMTVEV